MVPRVAVVGLWHQGAVAAACLPGVGYRVIGIDRSAERVESLVAGRAPVFEPGLDALLVEEQRQGRLSFSADRSALSGAEYVLVALDTEVDAEDVVNTQPVFNYVRWLAPALAQGVTLLVSSQVPVGTCERLQGALKALRPDLRFHLAASPENLRLGMALDRFMAPDLIIIGADNEDASSKATKFWAPLSPDSPRVHMSLRAAEMTKHALNCFFGTCISFANELSDVCEVLGIDAVQVTQAARLDRRIGPKAMLSPGLAFGGGHLTRDLRVVRDTAHALAMGTPLLDAVAYVNAVRNDVVIRKLKKALSGTLVGKTVTLLGLAYKVDTDTMYRAAALEIIESLAHAGAHVNAYDPKVRLEELCARSPHPVDIFDNPYDASAGSDALVVVTNWPEFADLDILRLSEVMRGRVLIDPHNTFRSAPGFQHLTIGRP